MVRRRFYSKCFFPQGGRKCTRAAPGTQLMLPMHKKACTLRRATNRCITNKKYVARSKKKNADWNLFVPHKGFRVSKIWKPTGFRQGPRKKPSQAQLDALAAGRAARSAAAAARAAGGAGGAPPAGPVPQRRSRRLAGLPPLASG
jgi:hypothetical protein